MCAKEKKMNAQDLNFFQEILTAMRRQLRGDVTTITKTATKKNQMHDAEGESSMPIHMADAGTDNFEQEFALSLAEVGSGRIKEIEVALQKIAAGSYGICEECGTMISKKRLEAIPYTCICIDCANKKSSQRK